MTAVGCLVHRTGSSLSRSGSLKTHVLQVNFVLPEKTITKYGIRGHIFADTGSIATLSGGAPAAERLDTFWNQWRLSVGLGVKVPIGMAGHFELNYAQPLTMFGSDVARSGLQIGFSTDPYLCVRPSSM